MRFLTLFLAAALNLAAQSQRFSFGFTGGVPLTTPGPSDSFFHNESRRYTLGVTFELFLNDQISLNLNPLYKRTGSSLSWNFPSVSEPGTVPQALAASSRIRNHSIELPVIGKYTFRPAGVSWRPFAGAGFALQKAHQDSQDRNVVWFPDPGQTRVAEGASDRWTSMDVGAVFASGVNFRRGRFTFAPELRYTRWGASNATHRRNQAEALFSIRF